MELFQNISPVLLGRGMLEITSTTINELAGLHLAMYAKFAERNVDSVAAVFKAKSFGDFIDLQRHQYRTLWSDRKDHMGSASEIIRRAVQQTNELWINPPAPPSAGETLQSEASETKPPCEAIAAAPVFELYEDQTGDHRFRLISSDGTELLTSESYKSQKGARNGVEAVRKNASNEARYERIETDSGLPMFNLKAGNHQIIGTSLPYQSASAMEDVLLMVKTASAVARIADR